MRIILDDEQTEAELDQILVLVAQVRTEHQKLRHLRQLERDGFPPSSIGGRGSPTNEVDDLDGTPIPQHPDPVGRLVVERDEARDPVGNALAQLVQQVHTSKRGLEAAVGAGRKVELPPKQDSDEIWCENCLKRANVKTPREEDRTVCSFCRHEKSEQGKLPSKRLIEAHTRGRVSPWMRQQIAARDAEDRAKRKAAEKKDRAAKSAACPA